MRRARRGEKGIPFFVSIRLAGGYISFPISSVVAATESTVIAFSHPALRMSAFMMNSAMGERQMLPWQTKSMCVIFLSLRFCFVFLLKCPIWQVFFVFSRAFPCNIGKSMFRANEVRLLLLEAQPVSLIEISPFRIRRARLKIS